MINKSDYIAWKNEPCTRQLLLAIKEKREHLKEGVVRGEASNSDLLHQTIGRCMAIEEVMEYILRDFEYIEEEILE